MYVKEYLPIDSIEYREKELGTYIYVSKTFLCIKTLKFSEVKRYDILEIGNEELKEFD